MKINSIIVFFISLICCDAHANIEKNLSHQVKAIDSSKVAGHSDQIKTPQSGKVIYEQYCIVCHREGLIGAPKFRDKNDWEKHTAGKKIEQLVTIATKGEKAMPAKGTCSLCTAADLKAAIEYMMPHHD